MTAPAYSCIIVDDDEIDRLTTYAYVRKFPFLDIKGQYVSAHEALEKLSGSQVDVLISDIDMPGMNGLDFRAQMMQIPACIFVTAFPDYAAEGFEAEAFDFLVKPLRKDRVDQCMNRLEAFLDMKRKAMLFDLSLGGDTVYIKDGTTKSRSNCTKSFTLRRSRITHVSLRPRANIVYSRPSVIS